MKKGSQIDLNDEHLDSLRMLQKNKDFQLYLKLLDNKFELEYNKLRKCLRDNGFYKIQGYLDGMEYARGFVDSIVQEHSHNPEKDG